MKEFITISKALSDEQRVRALMALKDGELCACQIIELLGLAPSTVSRHMSVLKQAGLVECRKDARWMYYRLPANADASAMIRHTLHWLTGCLKDDPAVAKDRKRMKGITGQDPSALCKLRRDK